MDSINLTETKNRYSFHICDTIIPGITDRVVSIDPGSGIDKIIIGQNIKNAIMVLGEPTEVFDLKKEKEDLKEYSDIETIHSFPFYLNFDSVYYFSNGNNYGIYKLYCKSDKIILIKLSAIFYRINNIIPKVIGKIGYYESIGHTIKNIESEAYIVEEEINPLFLELAEEMDEKMSTDKDFYFFKKGVNIYTTDDEILSFDIYQPISEPIITLFKQNN